MTTLLPCSVIAAPSRNLTANVADGQDPNLVDQWIDGLAPPPANLSRMRSAFQIARLLELATSVQTARSWFVGMNPYLDDRAPALVLADHPDHAARVMEAARAFLAHG